MKSNLALGVSRIYGKKYIRPLKLKISDGTGGTQAECSVDFLRADTSNMK
jgi:hypothetical protein